MIAYSDRVAVVLKAENISPQELDFMVSRAAITSLRGASRRYHHWLFRMQGPFVTHMILHTSELDHVEMWDDHEACNGEGCLGCGWSGQIPCN